MVQGGVFPTQVEQCVGYTWAGLWGILGKQLRINMLGKAIGGGAFRGH